jgi:uncharacterized membrane protein YphA (DoxX/SURF4 family)
VPAILIPALAWVSTIAEILLGFALVVGLFTRIAALLSGMILLLFALTMTIALGFKGTARFFSLFGFRRSLLTGCLRKVSALR